MLGAEQTITLQPFFLSVNFYLIHIQISTKIIPANHLSSYSQFILQTLCPSILLYIILLVYMQMQVSDQNSHFTSHLRFVRFARQVFTRAYYNTKYRKKRINTNIEQQGYQLPLLKMDRLKRKN